MNIFLDDERHPINDFDGYLKSLNDCFGKDYIQENWLVVRTYKNFCEAIQTKGLPERISLDHDIAEIKEGIDCVKWLIEYCLDNDLKLTSVCRYHTANPIGKDNMKSLIDNFKKFQNND